MRILHKKLFTKLFSPLDFLQLPDRGNFNGEQNRGNRTMDEIFCQDGIYYLLFHQLFFRLDIALNSDSGAKLG